MSKLKILHISSKDSGGAGIAAVRLHQGMIEYGLQSKFLCLEKTTDIPHIEVFPKFYPRFYHRIFERLGVLLTHGQKNAETLRKVQKSIEPEMYSFLRSDYQIHKHPLVECADIIIIHWVAGFLDFKSFFNNVPPNKKVYCYTHDFSIILGGFHTLFDAKRFKHSAVYNLEGNLKEQKRHFITAFKDLHIIANSQFSYNTIKQEGITKTQNLHCIPLGLPENEFQPIDKNIAKQALGFKKEDFVILSSSANLSSPRKGMNRLLQILESIRDRIPDLKVILLGSEGPNQKMEDPLFYYAGHSYSPKFKQILFSAADVVVSTSYEETFGQTIIEGYACATPALVFNNAALPELIKQEETGYVAESIDAFSNYIQIMANNRIQTAEMGNKALELFKEKFTTKRQIETLLELIISKK
jgi:glycosyltransferase involved in cell wall biosynthesis